MNAAERKVVQEVANLVRELNAKRARVIDDLEQFAKLDLIVDERLDSLDLINVLFRLEETFELKIPEPDIGANRLTNVGNLARYIVQSKGA